MKGKEGKDFGKGIVSILKIMNVFFELAEEEYKKNILVT